MGTERGRQGCFAVNSSVELGLRDEEMVDFAASFRAELRAAFGEVLARAASRGDIDAGRVEPYVETCVTLMLGFALIARSGADEAELDAVFEGAHATVESWRL